MCQVFYLTQAIKDKCHMGSFLKKSPPTRREESKQAGSYNTEKHMIERGIRVVPQVDEKGEGGILGPVKGSCL